MKKYKFNKEKFKIFIHEVIIIILLVLLATSLILHKKNVRAADISSNIIQITLDRWQGIINIPIDNNYKIILYSEILKINLSINNTNYNTILFLNI